MIRLRHRMIRLRSPMNRLRPAFIRLRHAFSRFPEKNGLVWPRFSRLRVGAHAAGPLARAQFLLVEVVNEQISTGTTRRVASYSGLPEYERQRARDRQQVDVPRGARRGVGGVGGARVRAD